MRKDERGKGPVRNRCQPMDDRGVSDVLGSVLMVGITVVAAAGMGILLLSFKGPANTQHTQLGVSVGPGSDGDWGTNDAELKIVHLGGEAVTQSRTRILYTEVGQAQQAVTPTFVGGTFTVGQTWTRTISAQPGDVIPVKVVVSTGGQSLLLASSSISAGAAGQSIIWVSGVTATQGSVEVANPLAGAQSATDGSAALGLDEAAVGGPLATTTQSPGTTTSSGATSAGNIVSSNDQWGTMSASNSFMRGASFTQPSGFAVSQIQVGAEMHANQAVSTVTHILTTQGTASGASTVVTTATLSASANDFFLAAIANGVGTPRAVLSVTGPVGMTWTQVGQVASSSGNGRIEVWQGTTAVPLTAGLTTATFSGGTVDKAAIAVSRYSGVDPASPIQATISGDAPGAGNTAVTLGAIAGTTSGLFYAASNGVSATGFTFTTPASERVDLDPGSNRVQLGVADGGASALNTLSASISGGSSDWQAIALTLRPLATPLPTVQLSYTLSGNPGTTTLSTALTTGADVTYLADVTADRSWALTDLPNVAVIVTLPTSTGSTVFVDYVFVKVTATSAPTTYTMDVSIDFDFGSTAMGTNEVVQLRFKSNGVDSFRAWMWTGASWRLCTGSLTATTYTGYTCPLSLPAEHNGGTPRMRFTDLNPAGTARATLLLEYARVSVS